MAHDGGERPTEGAACYAAATVAGKDVPGQPERGAAPRDGPPDAPARAEGSRPDPAGNGSGSAQGHGIGRRVLVIEDEPNISEAIRFILRRDGWGVATHATGDGALDRIRAEAPDLVILDLMLPGQSGLDILQDLRRDPALARLPVILLTARGQAATRELAQDCGASLFMAKPFGNGALLAAVRQLVGV